MKKVALLLFLFVFAEVLFATSIKKVNLSSQEEKYLNSIDNIKVCIDPKWFPVEEIRNDGEYVGITSEYIGLFSQWIGKEIKLVPTKTWNESLEKIKHGQCDILSAAARTKERELFLDFTKPYLVFPEVIATKGSVPFISEIEIFKYQGIGVVKDSAVESMLKELYGDIILIPVKDVETGLEEVAKGNIFGFINTSVSIGHGILTSEFQDLKISGSVGIDYELHIAVKKNSPELLSIFNKAVALISTKEQTDIRKKWVLVQFDKKFDYTTLFQILGVFVTILLISFYWIRKLRKEIQEKELAQKEVSRLSQAVEFSPTMVIITDTKGVVEYVNQAFCTITGYSRKEVIGSSINLIRSHHTKEKIYKKLWKTILNGDTWVGEFINKKKDSTTYWVSVSISPVFNKQGVITNFLSISEDITEKKENQFKLQEAMQRAQVATKAKSAFLANMSHDIRTPLNSIIGFSDILRQKVQDPVHKDYLNTIINGSHTLLSIINDILDLSKVEAGKMSIVKESVSPKQLFHDLGVFFLGATKDKNLDLFLDISHDLPDYVLLDGTRVKQVAMNLLSNAVKFTHSGSITLKVWCEYLEESKSALDLYFYVKDTGIGIKRENLDNIFNDFEQQEGQSSEYGGTGLGLSISRKLSHLLGGDIKVESTEGEGSLFSVVLRNIHVCSVRVDDLEEFNDVKFTGGKVILADDIEDNRKLVRIFLEESNVEIFDAQNGVEVLELLKTHGDVDVIILDIKMPKMNGYETIAHLKEEEKLKSIPVIALTASVMGEDSNKIEHLGFNGYLRKPVSKKSFINELKKYLPFYELDKKHSSFKFDIDIQKYPDLQKRLDDYIYELQELKRSGDFKRIEEYFKKFKALGIKESEKYLKTMFVHLQSVDILEVNLMLDYLIEKFSGFKDKK